MHVEPHENKLTSLAALRASAGTHSPTGSTVRGVAFLFQIMNDQPSPGPWIVLKPYTDRDVYPIAYRLPGPDEAYSIIAEVNSQGGTPEQCRRNADIFAAARELLEACKAAEKHYLPTPILIQLRNAIFSATGQES